jgi:hypothetical protein
VETWGGQIFLTVLLVVFFGISVALLVYGLVVGDGGLAILGMSIMIPMFFAVAVLLAMLFSWPDSH